MLSFKLDFFDLLNVSTAVGGKYKPHEKQLEFHRATLDYRNVYWVAGRQSGKSMATAVEIVYNLLIPHTDGKPHEIMLVSDKLRYSEALYDSVVAILTQTPDLKKRVRSIKRSTSKMELTLYSGAKLEIKSSHNPNLLAGDTSSLLITEESGFISDRAMSLVRPTLAIREGRHIAIGTADATNTWLQSYWEASWPEYTDVFSRGLPPTQESISLRAKSTDSPYFSAEELAQITQNETARNVRVLYDAEFESAEGRVISDELLKEVMKLPIPKKRYRPKSLEGRTFVAGVDLARHHDHTVVAVFETTENPAKLVRLERWQGMHPEATATKIAAILREFNAYAYVDSTGIGDVYVDLINKEWTRLHPFVFTGKSKPLLVQRMLLAFEQGSLLLYPDDALVSEFTRYTAKRGWQGNVKYEASTGHDDIPTAIALAVQGFSGEQRAIPTIRTLNY